jgi:hypothetical protein
MDYSALNAAVSGTSGSGGRPAFDPAKAAERGAQRFMKTYDANQDGSVSKDEFVTGLQAKGVSEADATKTYAVLDKAGSGSITKSDVESALKSGDVKPKDLGGARPPPPNGRGPDGPPPTASGSSSGAIKQYDPADTNQDGTVSMQESVTYAASQQAAAAATDPTNLGTQVDQMV